MEPYQEIVVEELNELSKKISKLSAFIQSNQFTQLLYHERSRLKIQYHVMKAYESILRERIEDQEPIYF